MIDGLYASSEIQFVSAYAPMVIVETDSAAAVAAARNAGVLSIDLLETESVSNEINSVRSASYDYEALMDGIDLANSISRADVVRDSIGLTGAGIKVGILEAEGVPDVENPYLDSVTIHLKNSTDPVSDHATVVAAIVAAEDDNGNPHGVAPNAELYCACGVSSAELFAGAEWMISSGVNVINCSFQIYADSGAYSAVSAWFDHIAVQHDVHIVAAAGNYNVVYERYVSSPGTAYNVITVGNFKANGSENVSDFEISGSSCYQEVASESNVRAEKPNLVAVGYFEDVKKIPPSDYSSSPDIEGTSFSAPQVTGVIAQLCEYADRLKVKQATMGAILMASAAKKVDAVGTGEKGDSFISSVRISQSNTQVSDKEGAGILDARWAWGICVQAHYWWENVEKDGFPYTKTVTIDATANTISRVAIFWLKRNTVTNHTSGTIDTTSASLARALLRIYGPDGEQITSSSLVDGNFQIVQFVPEETGTYTIYISARAFSRTNFGIALW